MPLLRRRDGDLVRDVSPYRRIMPILMPTRTEAAVLFEQRLDAEPALEFVRRWNEARPEKITLFHLVLHAIVMTLAERPRLNRFTSGGHLYQRRGIWLSWSVKKAKDDESPVVAVKRELDPSAGFEQLVARVQECVSDGRSTRPSVADRELALVLTLPLVLLRALLAVARWLDSRNLLPYALTRDDPMYASAFVVNLGSIKLDAVFHHNYEHGTVPIFVTVGAVQDGVIVRGGKVQTRKELPLRWTFDERIEDGLYCARAIDRLRERFEKGDPE